MGQIHAWQRRSSTRRTRLMFVPPEFARQRVRVVGHHMPHGNEPTAIGAAANPLLVEELRLTLSWLKFVFDRKTLPRAASTTTSPMVPCCGSE
jgi:hypothetical protein